MTYSVKQWEWAILKVMMRAPKKGMTKLEIFREAQILLDQQYKSSGVSPQA